MRFATLGSGSAGNAALIEHGGAGILVDCGLSTRRVEQRAATLGFDLDNLRGILVTHEHDDHVAGVASLSRKFGIPVYLSAGTRLAASDRLAQSYAVNELVPEAVQNVGPFSVLPVIVPHDAREPCQFIVRDGLLSLGILTDLGQSTAHLEQHYNGLDAMMLEFNHDPVLLSNSAYPAALRRRIAGDYGHLSNAQASGFLQRIETSTLQWLMAAHLSEKTNTPDLVAQHLEHALPAQVCTHIASQHEPSPWLEISPAARQSA